MFGKKVLLLVLCTLLAVFVIDCQARKQEEIGRKNSRRSENDESFERHETWRATNKKRENEETNKLREVLYKLRRLVPQKAESTKREEYPESKLKETSKIPASKREVLEEEEEKLPGTKRGFKKFNPEISENEEGWSQEMANSESEIFDREEGGNRARRREEKTEKFNQDEAEFKQEKEEEENVEKATGKIANYKRELKPLVDLEEEEKKEEQFLL